MAGRPPAVSDYEILRALDRAVREAASPVVTTGEITERLPIKREGAGRRLNELAENGLIERKQVGASYVWWIPTETAALVRPAEAETESEIGTEAETTQSLETRLDRLFAVGQNRFGLEVGAIARVDADEDRFEIEYTSDHYEGFERGTTLPLSETYCTTAAEENGPASIADPTDAGIEDRFVHTELGLKTYLGTLIDPADGEQRTVFFVSPEPRAEPYSESEHAFQALLGEGVKHALETGGAEALGA